MIAVNASVLDMQVISVLLSNTFMQLQLNTIIFVHIDTKSRLLCNSNSCNQTAREIVFFSFCEKVLYDIKLLQLKNLCHKVTEPQSVYNSFSQLQSWLLDSDGIKKTNMQKLSSCPSKNMHLAK